MTIREQAQKQVIYLSIKFHRALLLISNKRVDDIMLSEMLENIDSDLIVDNDVVVKLLIKRCRHMRACNRSRIATAEHYINNYVNSKTEESD